MKTATFYTGTINKVYGNGDQGLIGSVKDAEGNPVTLSEMIWMHRTDYFGRMRNGDRVRFTVTNNPRREGGFRALNVHREVTIGHILTGRIFNYWFVGGLLLFVLSMWAMRNILGMQSICILDTDTRCDGTYAWATMLFSLVASYFLTFGWAKYREGARIITASGMRQRKYGAKLAAALTETASQHPHIRGQYPLIVEPFDRDDGPYTVTVCKKGAERALLTFKVNVLGNSLTITNELGCENWYPVADFDRFVMLSRGAVLALS